MYWSKVEKKINELNPSVNTDEHDECEHDQIEIEGFYTCRICGIVLYQIFRTVSNINSYDFIEDKQIYRTKYSQIKEIRNKFLEYIITIQKPLSDDDYRKFKTQWELGKYKKMTKKNVLSCILNSQLEKKDMKKYFNILKHNKNINNSSFFTYAKINDIIQICSDFIKFYKGTLKNINKRCLIFVICIDYGIYLYDYIGFMLEKIINKYKILYADFQSRKIN